MLTQAPELVAMDSKNGLCLVPGTHFGEADEATADLLFVFHPGSQGCRSSTTCPTCGTVRITPPLLLLWGSWSVFSLVCGKSLEGESENRVAEPLQKGVGGAFEFGGSMEETGLSNHRGCCHCFYHQICILVDRTEIWRGRKGTLPEIHHPHFESHFF